MIIAIEKDRKNYIRNSDIIYSYIREHIYFTPLQVEVAVKKSPIQPRLKVSKLYNIIFNNQAFKELACAKIEDDERYLFTTLDEEKIINKRLKSTDTIYKQEMKHYIDSSSNIEREVRFKLALQGLCVVYDWKKGNYTLKHYTDIGLERVIDRVVSAHKITNPILRTNFINFNQSETFATNNGNRVVHNDKLTKGDIDALNSYLVASLGVISDKINNIAVLDKVVFRGDSYIVMGIQRGKVKGRIREYYTLGNIKED